MGLLMSYDAGSGGKPGVTDSGKSLSTMYEDFGAVVEALMKWTRPVPMRMGVMPGMTWRQILDRLLIGLCVNPYEFGLLI
jgi:hypothetical protein